MPHLHKALTLPAMLPKIHNIQILTKENFYSTVELRLRNLGRADSTIDIYISALKNFVNYCGEKEINTIDTSDFEKFTKDALKRKLKSGTLKSIKYSVNFGFNEVLNSGIDTSSMHTPSSPKQNIEYFEKREILQFLSVIKNIKHRTILELIYSSGLDLGDIINIKITDVQTDKKQIVIRNEKRDIKQEVYLSPTILDNLREYYKRYKPQTYLFEGREKGERFSVRTIQAIFQSAMKECKINKELTTRSLKYSYVKHLAEDGIPINSILNKLKIDDGNTIKTYMNLCYPIKKFNLSPIDTLKSEYEDFEFFDTTELEHLLVKVKDKEERDYLLEGIKCLKANALRAGVIFIWTAAVYKIQKKCIQETLLSINKELQLIQKGSKEIRVFDDFEFIKDSILIELACRLKIIDKYKKEELKNNCLGLRNKCGHPSRYKPKGQKIKSFVEDIIEILY